MKPEDVPYVFTEVPNCDRTPPLNTSCVEAPTSRARWLAIRGEMKGLCDEAVRRRALKLLSRGARQRSALAAAGAPLFEAYIADRLDLDDPLEGLVVRHRVSGWLQGFITRTTFTTWTPHFAWDSRHHASGLKGLVGSGRLLDVGARTPSAPRSAARSSGAGADRERACKQVLETGNDPLMQPGESLADALERQPRSGNWRSTGIVWPGVAEISLLAALGAGDWLLSVVLEELARDDRYEFCVVCATPGAATFYERHGFVRVGAIARYLDPEEARNNSDDVPPAKPWQAYRHWAWGDERRESLRTNHNEPSYMMARRVARRTGEAARRAAQLLRQRDQRLAVKCPRIAQGARPQPGVELDYFAPPPPPTPAPAPRTPAPAPAPRPPPRAAAPKPKPAPKPAKPAAKPAKPAAAPAAPRSHKKRPASPPEKPRSHKKKPRAKPDAKPPRRAAAVAAKEALKTSGAK